MPDLSLNSLKRNVIRAIDQQAVSGSNDFVAGRRLPRVNTRDGIQPLTATGAKIESMRPVEFCEAVPSGTRLTLFSADKPDRHFTVITFCIDKVSGVALDLETGVPCYEVEDEEGRIHLLLQLPIGEANENRWCLWRPDWVGFDSRSIFDGALVEE